MDKIKIATIWLAGCSGCHMSFLDLDEWLFDLAEFAEIVFSPVVDTKVYPEEVDVLLIEGAVGADEHVHLIRRARERTKLVISFGDCAITGNVSALRNPLGKAEIPLERAYVELADVQGQIPQPGAIPKLLDRVQPVHEVIHVDMYLPGCPPSASRIKAAIQSLLSETPEPLHGREMIKFG